MVSFLIFSFCNTTHLNVEENTKKIVKSYLPELFQPNLFCAGYDSNDQGPCKGDSGGPLMFHNAGKYKVRKISSF